MIQVSSCLSSMTKSTAKINVDKTFQPLPYKKAIENSSEEMTINFLKSHIHKSIKYFNMSLEYI